MGLALDAIHQTLLCVICVFTRRIQQFLQRNQSILFHHVLRKCGSIGGSRPYATDIPDSIHTYICSS